jgi:hypothetical protein
LTEYCLRLSGSIKTVSKGWAESSSLGCRSGANSNGLTIPLDLRNNHPAVNKKEEEEWVFALDLID